MCLFSGGWTRAVFIYRTGQTTHCTLHNRSTKSQVCMCVCVWVRWGGEAECVQYLSSNRTRYFLLPHDADLQRWQYLLTHYRRRKKYSKPSFFVVWNAFHKHSNQMNFVPQIIIPLKKSIMFLTEPLGLSVCVSVCHYVWARWLDLATWCQVRLILSIRTWKCNTSHDDPFPFPFHMGHLDKITFWPITSKFMDGFTLNFNSM